MVQKLSSPGDPAARRGAGSLDADVRSAAHLAILRGEALSIRRAWLPDAPIITGMLDDAKERLRRLGTDQWSTDWHDKEGHNRADRQRASLMGGTTWLAGIVLDPVHPEMVPVASVAVERTANPLVWSQREAKQPALYLSRLVVAEGFSGLHVGAAILDWAGRHGWINYGTSCIRLDAWTTNKALHDYYEKRGFKRLKPVRAKNYPSRARFQRPASSLNGDGPVVVELERVGYSQPYRQPATPRPRRH